MKKLKEFLDSPWYRKNASPFAIGLCLGLLALYTLEAFLSK